MKEKKYMICAIDIGTSKIKTLIGNVGVSGRIEIISYGQASTVGTIDNKPVVSILKGTFIHPEIVTKAVAASVAMAEEKIKTQAYDVSININGDHIMDFNSSSSINISEDKVVQEKHLDMAVKNAIKEFLRPNLQVLHAIPRRFKIDEKLIVASPLGLSGDLMRADTYVLTCSKDHYGQYYSVINEAGFSMDAIYSSMIVNEAAVLTDEQKEDGVLLIDFGAGCTSYVYYKNGVIQKSKVFSIGGDHFKNDLILGLDLSPEEAEDIIRNYSKIEMNNDSSNIIQMRSSNKNNKKIDPQDITMILSARAEELIYLIDKDLNLNDNIKNVVFVGGGANSELLNDKGRQKFGVPCIKGVPRVYDNLEIIQDNDIYFVDADEIKSPEWVSAVGILKYAARQKLKEQKNKPGLISKIFSLK